MKVFRNLREFIWPLMDKADEVSPNQIAHSDLIVSDENLEKVLEISTKDFQAEEDRSQTVESKSALIIGTITVITSVVLAVTTVMVKDNTFNTSVFILVLLLWVLTLYMARTIWFSIKVLERKTYHTIDVEDYLVPETGDEYLKNLIVKIINKTRANSDTINMKVNDMVMAQEYFKRAIVVLTLYSFVILLFFVSKSNLGVSFDGNEILSILNNINLNVWNTIIVYVLIILSLSLSIGALTRKRK